jgi:hypothetical protein
MKQPAGQPISSSQPVPEVDQAPAQPANGNGSSKEKETALKFLKVIVENSSRGQTDPTVITNTVGANIANMPMVSKYFTADSPETMNLIMEAMSK